MSHVTTLRTTLVVLAIALLPSAPVIAGRIVVNHDEWTLSDTGRAQAGAASFDNFVGNLAAYMNINGGACNFLVYSSNFGLTQAGFQTAMTGAGCALTNYAGPFNAGVGLLSNYDGIFLALNPTTYDPAALASYVNAGGSAYIAAGTGALGAAGEAAHWNQFLNGFGLVLGSPYNGCCGIDTVTQSHIIEAGVTQLYSDNGNTVSLNGGDPNAQIIEFSNQGLGLIGVYDNVRAGNAPVPATIACLLLGLGLMTLVRGRGRGAACRE